VKKSKREKEKEAAEAKQKMEEEHAAKAYAEFLDAFDADDSAPVRRSAKSSTFVRSSRDSGTTYTPSGPSRSETHSRSMRAFEPSKVCCSIIERGHPYMTAVSVSSSYDEAERQTRHGCLLRRDQEVRLELHNTRARHTYHCCEGIRQTERLGLLGIVSS
jgi:U2-associated protein SR140